LSISALTTVFIEIHITNIGPIFIYFEAKCRQRLPNKFLCKINGQIFHKVSYTGKNIKGKCQFKLDKKLKKDSGQSKSYNET